MNRLNPRLRVDVLLNLAAGTFQRQEVADLHRAIDAAFDTENLDAQGDGLAQAEFLLAAERSLARAKRHEIDAVIVGGGDGTLHTAANVFADTSIPLGVLPLGTFNHFAKDAGIPTALDQAIETITKRHTVDVDVAEVNGRIFVNNSCIGIYPDIVLHRERERHASGLNKWAAHFLGAWRVVQNFPLHRLLIHAEGRGAPFKTPCVFVGNNEYGLRLPLPGHRTRLDEGMLCLYVAKTQRPLSLFWLACRALTGLLDIDKDLETFKDEAAEVRSRRTLLPVALDGEIAYMRPPLRYRIRRRALRVFAPPRKES